MVDKNVFKMDMSLLQRFRILQKPSASIERLLPKTFVSDANFNVNPPVLPKQSLDSASKPQPPAERSRTSSAILNRPKKGQSPKKACASSSGSAKQIGDVPKTPSTIRQQLQQQQAVTKASLRALKSTIPSPNLTTNPSSVAVVRLPDVSIEQTTETASEAPFPEVIALSATLLSSERVPLIRKTQDLYFIRNHDNDSSISSQQGGADKTDCDQFTCVELSRTSLETCLKMIRRSDDAVFAVSPEQHVVVSRVGFAKMIVNNRKANRHVKKPKVTQQPLPPNQTLLDCINETPMNAVSCISQTPDVPLPQKQSLPPSNEHTTLPSPAKPVEALQEPSTPVVTMSADPLLQTLQEPTSTPQDRPAPRSVKKARMKITQRRNVLPPPESAWMASAMPEAACFPQHQPDAPVNERTTLECSEPVAKEGDDNNNNNIDDTVSQSTPKDDVKEEPIDFVDLLSLPDEPEKVVAEGGDIAPVPITPLDAHETSTPLKNLDLIAHKTPSLDAPTSSESYSPTLDHSESNLRSTSKRVIPCAPFNHRFRRRFQQMLHMSHLKRRRPCHTFYDEQRPSSVEQRTQNSEQRNEQRSPQTSTVSSIPSGGSQSLPDPLSSTATSPITNSTGSHVNKSPERTDRPTPPPPHEIIILGDDSSPSPPRKRFVDLVSGTASFSSREVQSDFQSSSGVLEIFVMPSTSQETEARHAGRAGATPYQRAAPVLVDLPQHLGEQQNISSLLSPSTAINASTVTLRPAAISLETTSPIPIHRSPPPVIPLSTRPSESTYAHIPAMEPPSPPTLVPKIIPSNIQPTLINLVDASVMCQPLKTKNPIEEPPPQQQFHAGQQTPLQVGPSRRPPAQVQMVHSVIAGQPQYTQSTHPPHQLTSQPQLQEQTQLFYQKQQPVNFEAAAAQQQPQPLQQQTPISAAEEKLYRCGYCGLTGSDMTAVAIHIISCRP